MTTHSKEMVRVQAWIERKESEIEERRLVLAEHNRRENQEMLEIQKQIGQANSILRNPQRLK